MKSDLGGSQTVESAQVQALGTGGGISLRSVSHSYGDLQTLAAIDLEAAPHSVVGLVGPSGCGKSTLLELICGLQEPSRGAVAVGGDSAAEDRLQRCAFMPQRDLLLPWYSAIDNAALALRNQGMRKRVAFLRTLVAGKPVLALDEPFAALDAITRAEMQEWLAAALRSDPRTVVLVTHDVEEALYLCDRVAILSARPASVVAELSPRTPRAEGRDAAVTDPGFVALREEALRALRHGMRGS
jgi:NitT/TauT family transport system ATP-binding protein